MGRTKESIQLRQESALRRKNVRILNRIDRKTNNGERLSRGELIFLYDLDGRNELLGEKDKIRRRKTALRTSAISSLNELKKGEQECAIDFVNMVYLRSKGHKRVEKQSDLFEDSVYIRIHQVVVDLGLEYFFDESLKRAIFCHNEDLSSGETGDFLEDVLRKNINGDLGIVMSYMDGTTEIIPRENIGVS